MSLIGSEAAELFQGGFGSGCPARGPVRARAQLALGPCPAPHNAAFTGLTLHSASRWLLLG